MNVLNVFVSNIEGERRLHKRGTTCAERVEVKSDIVPSFQFEHSNAVVRILKALVLSELFIYSFH